MKAKMTGHIMRGFCVHHKLENAGLVVSSHALGGQHHDLPDLNPSETLKGDQGPCLRSGAVQSVASLVICRERAPIFHTELLICTLN